MREVIMEKLREIALKEDVKIIYAAESGSRAWGFESPDSDYDVRFIYVRKQEDYLRILPRRDVIEWQLDETLDINGWDIQKAMLLLLKSNPTLFEWANSPIVYQTTQQWESLKEIINQYFSSKSGVYHYLHMAGRNYREFLKADQVKQKKYLYVLRPILACRWILRTQTPPPMEFESLVRAEMEPELLPLVMQLLENKRKSSELETIARIQPLNDYIEKQLETLHAAVVSMPKETHQDVDLLNEHFREIVLSDIRNRHLETMNGREWIDFVFRNALTPEELTSHSYKWSTLTQYVRNSQNFGKSSHMKTSYALLYEMCSTAVTSRMDKMICLIAPHAPFSPDHPAIAANPASKRYSSLFRCA